MADLAPPTARARRSEPFPGFQASLAPGPTSVVGPERGRPPVVGPQREVVVGSESQARRSEPALVVGSEPALVVGSEGQARRSEPARFPAAWNLAVTERTRKVLADLRLGLQPQDWLAGGSQTSLQLTTGLW